MLPSTILSLVLLILTTHLVSITRARKQIWCYECAYGSIPASVDVCRPGNFNVSSVHTVRCPHGCGISIIYEFEPNALQAMSNPLSNATSPTRTSVNSTWISHKKNVEKITFVARQCAQKRLTKQACEIKEFTNVHHEECYCNTDYCNGQLSLSPMNLHTNNLFLFIVVTISQLAPQYLLYDYIMATRP